MIHRYWTGPERPDAAVSRQRLVTMNPRQEVRDWTDQTLPAEVVAWCDLRSGDVIAADRPRHRANMIRLWLLREYGGWWVDHDVTMLREFAALPSVVAASLGGAIATCLLGLPAGHQLAHAAIARIDAHTGRLGRCPDVSGDRLLEGLRQTHGKDLRLLPLPFDARGRWTGVLCPVLIHEWGTSSQRVAKGEPS